MKLFKRIRYIKTPMVKLTLMDQMYLKFSEEVLWENKLYPNFYLYLSKN